MGKAKGKHFYHEDKSSCYNYNEIKDLFNEMKRVIISADSNIIRKWYEENEIKAEGLVAPMDTDTIYKALATAKGSVEDPPPDAVQQHAYAQQQWTNLFNTFTMYKHIFGQSKSEIRPEKILKDNKFLYTLLPPLELQAAQVEILGKLQVMAIKEVAALALGGAKLSQHITIGNIFRDRFTPKPFTLVVLDEYGAFPVDGIDTILAQVRSLNMSVIISVQDLVSLKPGGKGDTAQKRALANLTKLFYKIEDDDVIKWVEGMVSKHEVEVPEVHYDAGGNLVADTKVATKDVENFDPKKLRDFDKGFGVLQKNGTEFGTTYVQTFFRGGEPKSIFVKKYRPYRQ